jgi:hypothetical protein
MGTLPVRLALRNQLLRFSVPKLIGLAAGYALRRDAHDSGSQASRARLVPRLRQWPRFVGAGELVIKAKAFDDGLLAAVEVASQEACGAFRGKRPVLRGLREKLADGGRAASLIEAACELGVCAPETSAAPRPY